jgi:hypothetical protein
MEPKNDEALLGTAAGKSGDGSAPVPAMVDISEYFTGIDYADTSKTDITGFFVAGLRSMAPVTITGRWEPNDALTDLVLSVCLGGIRAPRKTKKAFRKLWTGKPLNRRERDRIRRKPYENA